jgi:hypothetical protein
MADETIGGFEGDQTGMGQGLAYVLPQSRTTGYFMQLANERAHQRRAEAAALQAQQQKANEDYANHLYAFKTPEIANEYTKWLQPKFDDLLSQASDYHAQTGQDPFTNPHFVQQTNDLNTVAKSTHQANLRATALGTALADKSKNYTPESKQANTEWLQNYYKDPVGSLYNAPPPLQQRDLDLNDAVKLGHANANVRSAGGFTITEPNSHNHVVQGQAILSQPEFAPYLQQNGINPTVGDAFGQPNGHGGTIYPTDAPTVNAIADHIIQNATQPHFASTLQAAGIDPADPHAKDKLTELVQRQNAGYGKVLGDFRDRMNANVETKKVPDYNPERIEQGWQRIFDAQQRHNDAQAKQTTPIYRQNWVTGMLSGDADSGEQLKAKIDADPSYDKNSYGGLGFHIGKMGTKIALNVPAKTVLNAAGETIEKIPQRQIVVDKADPNADIKLNEAVNQLTGEKVDISALRTLGGKKHLPVVENNAQPTSAPHGKVATMQQIQSKVGTKGYEGYTAQELADYYKAQGYTIK